MSSSMQPVNLSMSNLNVDSAARTSPNAFSAAQETGQSQEIIRDGIRAVQRVQANDATAAAQRVHRKNAGDEQEGQDRQGRQSRQGSQDTYEHAQPQSEAAKITTDGVIIETHRSKKGLNFLA